MVIYTCTSFCYFKSLEEEIEVTHSEYDSGKERASELEQKVDHLVQNVKIAEENSSAQVSGLCLVICLLSYPPPFTACPFVVLFR